MKDTVGYCIGKKKSATMFIIPFAQSSLKQAHQNIFDFLEVPCPAGRPFQLDRRCSTLPHLNGSDYLQKNKQTFKKPHPEPFQEIICFRIPFLERSRFHPSFREAEPRAKLSSVPGPRCISLVKTAAETTLLCVFMDKRHCNCISSRPG